jgi:hypothetical protein
VASGGGGGGTNWVAEREVWGWPWIRRGGGVRRRKGAASKGITRAYAARIHSD